MKFRNCIFLCLAVVSLFSCNKKKEEKGENNQQETEQVDLNESLTEVRARMNNDLNGHAAEDEIIKEFLYINDEYIKKRNAKIIFIEKANLGTPGGDNWIVLLSTELIFIYAISEGKIEENYSEKGFYLDGRSDFDIMQNIPGTHIGGTTSSFGDFNGDGIDELFRYAFYGRGYIIEIWGYDKIKDDFVYYCEIPFDIIDSTNGPAPVEFMTYQGMYGFKVYYSQIEVAGGPGWVPDPDPKNDKWIFFTWDAEQRKYIEIGEVVD
jgi:hypothetical protein